MTRESLVTQDWEGIVARLGGATTLEQSARDTKAFLRARAIATAVDLLRLILAYCLGDRGLRSTAAWATAIGLANLSNVALLQRLRRCGDWLALLVGEALAAAAPQASRGLKGPPGADERSARPYVLAHLLIILLLEPLVDGLEDSPRWAESLPLAA